MYVDRERVRARAKRHNRVFILIFGWLFAILGLGLMCGGVWMALEGVEFRKGADTTEAVILAMRGKTRESLGMPHVRYHVAGKTYEATLTSASGDMNTHLGIRGHAAGHGDRCSVRQGQSGRCAPCWQ